MFTSSAADAGSRKSWPAVGGAGGRRPVTYLPEFAQVMIVCLLPRPQVVRCYSRWGKGGPGRGEVHWLVFGQFLMVSGRGNGRLGLGWIIITYCSPGLHWRMIDWLFIDLSDNGWYRDNAVRLWWCLFLDISPLKILAVKVSGLESGSRAGVRPAGTEAIPGNFSELEWRWSWVSWLLRWPRVGWHLSCGRLLHQRLVVFGFLN